MTDTETVTLLPHVWLQRNLPGAPTLLAGQVVTSQGRAAGYKRSFGSWLPVPVRLAPRTQEGLDQLFDQLEADARKVEGATA